MAIVGIGIGFRVISWNSGSINSKSRSSRRSTISSPKYRSTSNRVNSRGRNYSDLSLRFRSIAFLRANASSGLNRPRSSDWNNAAKVAQDGPSLVKANKLYPICRCWTDPLHSWRMHHIIYCSRLPEQGRLLKWKHWQIDSQLCQPLIYCSIKAAEQDRLWNQATTNFT
jgi:hypothetical protein